MPGPCSVCSARPGPTDRATPVDRISCPARARSASSVRTCFTTIKAAFGRGRLRAARFARRARRPTPGPPGRAALSSKAATSTTTSSGSSGTGVSQGRSLRDGLRPACRLALTAAGPSADALAKEGRHSLPTGGRPQRHGDPWNAAVDTERETLRRGRCFRIASIAAPTARKRPAAHGLETSCLQGVVRRTGRDSNPRWSYKPHTRLAGECLQPLGHLSPEDRSVEIRPYGGDDRAGGCRVPPTTCRRRSRRRPAGRQRAGQACRSRARRGPRTREAATRRPRAGCPRW